MVPEFVARTRGSRWSRALPGGGLGERKAITEPPQPRRQRRLAIRRKFLRIRRIRELQFMVPEFVARTGGSKWLSALPTGSRCVQAQPARVGSADP